MKKLLTSAILLTGAIGFSLVVSGCSPKSFDEKVEWGSDKVSGYLDLTEKQEPSLNAIADTIKSKYPEFQKIRSKMADTIKSELIKDQFDTSTVLAEVEALETHVNDTSDELIKELAVFHTMLTSEQREKIQKLSKKSRSRRWHSWRDRDNDRSPDMKRSFNFQPHQADALKQLLSGIASDSVDLMLSNNQLKTTVKEQLATETFDTARMKSALDALTGQFFNSVKKRLPEFAALHATMTADQKMILVNTVDRMMR